MFKGLGNLAGMLKQAQQMGSRLQELNETLRAQRAEGAAGGGMVTVEVNGLGEVLACRIDPSVATDRELVEDLIPAAVNAALARAKSLHADAMRSMTSGMDLPGFEEMMAQVTGPQDPPDGGTGK
jgi:nucleoid-associated protein EbfC